VLSYELRHESIGGSLAYNDSFSEDARVYVESLWIAVLRYRLLDDFRETRVRLHQAIT